MRNDKIKENTGEERKRQRYAEKRGLGVQNDEDGRNKRTATKSESDRESELRGGYNIHI